MNAASTAHQQTVADQRAHEPSMEEILASIRRIIADDDVLPLSRQSSASLRPVQPAPQPGPAPFGSYEPQRNAAPRRDFPPQQQEDPFNREPHDAIPQRPNRTGFRLDLDPPSRPAPEPMARPFEAAQPPMGDEAPESLHAPLVSPGADASVSSSFNALAASMMMQNGNLIEDSVREMLRPMLKTWLDDNLPGIVERLVRQEIERMARGRR